MCVVSRNRHHPSQPWQGQGYAKTANGLPVSQAVAQRMAQAAILSSGQMQPVTLTGHTQHVHASRPTALKALTTSSTRSAALYASAAASRAVLARHVTPAAKPTDAKLLVSSSLLACTTDHSSSVMAVVAADSSSKAQHSSAELGALKKVRWGYIKISAPSPQAQPKKRL